MNRAALAPDFSARGGDLPRPQALWLTAGAVAVYLALAGFLFFAILHGNGGHFTYALDDPYIHLALSEGIAHGHYGINAGESASPSSSLLWPLLLALFARFSWQEYVPLALNLMAGVATAILIGASVARWPGPRAGEPPNTERWRRGFSVVGLLFIGNLLGLTFVGMEHTLQVLLAGVGAWGIVDCLRGRQIPAWVLVCTALGPAVRYENLAITIALAVALLGWRKRRQAALLVIASVAPLLAFSLFLHHLGLPWLPTSVLVKGGLAAPGMGLQQRGLTMIETASLDAFAEPHRQLLTVLLITIVALAWAERDRVRRFALGGAAIAAGLHLAIGRFHWFHRYEVYAVFFSALVILHVAHERQRGLLGWYVLGLLGCSYLYIQAFEDVPRSAGDVYREQYQMHRFVTEYYTGNFAVNDLGLASYRRQPGTYVLDLWGLGSEEAARQRNKSTAWLNTVTRTHDVDLVMDYALWFSPPPGTWRLLGEVCLKKLPVALGDPCVNYYATNPATASDLQIDFNEFASTMPPGVVVRHPFLPPPPLPAPAR